jgi:hypothetical protein
MLHSVAIEYATTIDLSSLKSDIQQSLQLSNRALNGINFLSHLIRAGPSKRFPTHKKLFFCTAPRIEWAVDRVFEFRKGFVQSLRWGSINGLTINIDTVTMICWDPTPNVAPLVQRVLQEDSATKITCPLSELQEQRLKKLLKLNFGSSMDCNRTPSYIV